MAKSRATQACVPLTPEDRRIIDKLRRLWEPLYGKQTLVGVIRIALRKAVKP